MRNAAVRDRGKTRSAAERDHRTLLELRDWRRNVGATSLLDLDLHPNVAGIGTLQRVLRFLKWRDSWWKSNGTLIEKEVQCVPMVYELTLSVRQHYAWRSILLFSHLSRFVPDHIKLVPNSMAM